MALWDEVASRYSSEKLVAFTNPDDRTATAVDSAVAALAVADTEAAFQLHAEIAYSSSDARHVSIACRGVLAFLMSYGGAHGDGAASAMERFEKQLERLRDTTSRARLSPTTQSELVPTNEFENGEAKPDFDRSRFGGYVPENRGDADPLPDIP